MNLHCDECGCHGNEEDGIEPGGECVTEGCTGIVKRSDPIYRTIYTVTVYTQGPITDFLDLTDIAHLISYGDGIGGLDQTSSYPVPDEAVYDALVEIGNDGTFFDVVAEGYFNEQMGAHL